MPALSTRRPLQWSQYPLQCAPSRRCTARSHYNALSLCPRFNGSPGARIAIPLASITMRSHVVQPRFKGSSGPEPESPYRLLHYNVNQVAVPLAPITQCALTTTTIQGLSWNPNCHTTRSHYNTVSYEMAPLLDHKIPHAGPRSDTHYHGIQRYVCDFTGSITCHHLPAAKSPQNGSRPTHTPQALVVMRLQLTTNRHGYKLQSTHGQQLL
jgi:hypothetical protein